MTETMETRYFVSIGSNIKPTMNIPLILQALLQKMQIVSISRIMATPAVDMLDNTQAFYNLVAAFDSHMNSAELKSWLIDIEIQLGRDRDHPLSKMLGRPADIDEIMAIKTPIEINKAELPPEPHVRPMLVELLNYLKLASLPVAGLTAGIEIQFHDQRIGTQPITLKNRPAE